MTWGYAKLMKRPSHLSDNINASTSRSSVAFNTKPNGGMGESGGEILSILSAGIVSSLLSALRSNTPSFLSCFKSEPLMLVPSLSVMVAKPNPGTTTLLGSIKDSNILSAVSRLPTPAKSGPAFPPSCLML